MMLLPRPLLLRLTLGLTVGACSLSLLFMSALTPGQSARAQNLVSSPSSDLEALMAKAVTAVNSRKTAGLASLTAQEPAALFPWVPSAHETWEGATITVPTGAAGQSGLPDDPQGERLAIFHAWHSCQSDGDHVHRLVHSDRGWQLGAEIEETETLGLRVRDHDLHAAFDIPRKTMQLSDTIQLERTSEAVPRFGLLRISHDFHVNSVFIGGAESRIAVRFQQAGGVIAFAPPADKRFVLTLRYAGHLDNKESDYIRENEAVVCSYWYPQIARLPATTTVTATVPGGWTAVAQGELTNEIHAPDGAMTVTYRNDVPNCFYTLDIGRYQLTTRQVKGRALTVYQLQRNQELAKACLDTLAESLEFYDKNFAPFPYHSYGVVETNGAFSGALEAYSFATFGPNTLPALLPHELAHTWWGGAMPCTYTRSMWDEAFAEYSDDLFTRSRLPIAPNTSPVYPASTTLFAERRKEARAFAGVPVAHAFDTENDQHVPVGYEKGKLVLKVLERQLGPEMMLRSMRRFFAYHAKGEPAEWAEFEAAVNKESGSDYRWFFSQWLERKGLPVLWLSNVTSRKEGAGYLIEADVVQTGLPYRLSLPVLLDAADGITVAATILVDGRVTHLALRSSAPPTRLRLDPQGIVPFTAPLSAAPIDQTVYNFAP